MKSNKEMIFDAEKTNLPLLPSERHLGLYGHSSIQIAWGISGVVFITGPWLGATTSVVHGMIAAFFGCVVALLYQNYLAISYSRWGIDQSILGRATFGTKGMPWMLIIIGIPIAWGWTCLPAIMMGRTISVFLKLLGITGFITNPTIWALLVFALGMWIGYIGTQLMNRLYTVITPVILVLVAILTFIIFKDYGEVFSIIPRGFSDSSATNFMIALEMSVGVGFSWAFYYSGFTVPCKTEVAGYYGTFLGWGVISAACMLPAIAAGTLTGSTDPVEALSHIGGGFWVMLWLAMLIIANLTPIICNPYWISVSLVSMFPKLTWKKAILINCVVVILIVIPAIYDTFGRFISFIAAFYGPLGSIWVTDILLRKNKFNLRHLYSEEKGNAYYYWGGVNYVAMLAAGMGLALSLAVYNPFTMTVHIPGIFNYVGASIPGSILAVIVYYIAYKVFIVPKGYGIVETNKPV